MPNKSKDHGGNVKWESMTPADIKHETFTTQFQQEHGVPFVVRASGPCPRCGHPIVATHYLYEVEMFTGGEPSPDVLDSLREEVGRRVRSGALKRLESYRCPVYCTCGLPHKGRPVNEREGCGASFVLLVDAPTP